jgi:hypothetical protein
VVSSGLFINKQDEGGINKQAGRRQRGKQSRAEAPEEEEEGGGGVRGVFLKFSKISGILL